MMHPLNPLASLRVLVWLLWQPWRYEAYRRRYAGRLHEITAVLANTLAWLPLALPLVAARLHDDPTSPALLVACGVGWLITTALDQRNLNRGLVYLPLVIIAGGVAVYNGVVLTEALVGVAVVLAASSAALIANEVESGGAFVVGLVVSVTQAVTLMAGLSAALAGGVATVVAFFAAVYSAQRGGGGTHARVIFVLVGSGLAGLLGGWRAGLAFGVLAIVTLVGLMTLPDRMGIHSSMERGGWMGRGLTLALGVAYGFLIGSVLFGG